MESLPNEALRGARLEHHWTQLDVADRLKVTELTVGRWERGEMRPSAYNRKQLSQLFGKSEAELFPPQQGETASQGVALTPARVPQNLPQTHRIGDKNRRRMLQRIRSRWVAGILEHSLYQGILLDLVLLEQPDAVEDPWQEALEESHLPPRRLDGMSITQIYDEADGELLILGEPGAGKTTLLLQLTRDLLGRAEQEEDHPLPVVFNLSSWSQPFTAWLVEELQTKYQVPRKLGQEWINEERLLLLLDGLDEVASDRRVFCIEAINAYRQAHGMVPIVVCSRSADYHTASARLLLQTAVEVQPLTRRQIDAYVTSADESLAALQLALQRDASLQELATSPLLLSILVWTYQNMHVEEILTSHSRHRVMENYVERMLARRRSQRYPPQQAKHWLSCLAQQLVSRGQREFLVERLQPDWLPPQTQKRYRHSMVQVIFGIEVILVSALFSWLRGGKKGQISGVGIGLLGHLGAGPGNTLLGWMAPGLGGGLEGGGSLGIILAIVSVLIVLLVSLSHIPNVSLQALWHGISKGVQSGLAIGSSVGVFSGFLFRLVGGLWYGVDRVGWVPDFLLGCSQD